MNSLLADVWLVDKAGIYTHYDHRGECDEIEIPNSHFRLHRTGNQWCVTVTTGPPGNPTGTLTFSYAEPGQQ